MVTSDEERQGVTGGDQGPPAEPVAAPAPQAGSDPIAEGLDGLETPPETESNEAVEGEEAPSDEAELEGVAPTTMPVEASSEPVLAEPISAEQVTEAAVAEIPAPARDSAEAVEAQAPLPDPAAGAELSEDEATGRRVESLLAEAPDADPQATQPARGETSLEVAPANDIGGDVIAPMTFDAPGVSFDADDDIPPMPRSSAPFREGLRRNGMDRVGPIVAFDFDGTLTVRDSFTAFLRWREGSTRYHAEMASLAPAALKYLFDRDPGKLKAAAVRRFLQGLPRDVLNAEAMEFATVSAPVLFRPDALRAWRRFRADGARLMIVTASPENIVAPFARGLGCDLLIATQLIFDVDDRVQGGLLGDNCRGAEKARRIRQMLGEDVVLAAAYGDTDGDWEMLEMAEQQFMRLFVGTPGKPGGPG